MGFKGKIEYGAVYTKQEHPLLGEATVKQVKYCLWRSKQGFSDEEYQEIANKLNVYFGAEARTKCLQYFNGTTYWYYWEDPDNGLSVSLGHSLYGYSPDGCIEIVWANKFCENRNFLDAVD